RRRGVAERRCRRRDRALRALARRFLRRRGSLGRRRGRGGSRSRGPEVDPGRFAIGWGLDLEELALPEAERSCEHGAGEGLDRVVVAQHRAVVTLSRSGDLILGPLELALQLLEV